MAAFTRPFAAGVPLTGPFATAALPATPLDATPLAGAFPLVAAAFVTAGAAPKLKLTSANTQNRFRTPVIIGL